MKKFKGTKKPWSIIKKGGVITGIGTSEQLEFGVYSEVMCEFILPDTGTKYAEGNIEADAKLIATAPILLEALQGLLSDVEDMIGNHGDEYMQCGYIQVAKDAIEKAL